MGPLDRAGADRSDRTGATWTNWAGDRSCRPRDLVRPGSLRELSEVVAAGAAAGRQITVAGSGHSFSGAAMSDDLMLDVGALSGVIEADRAGGLVRVGGGTVLAELNRELDRLGLAMPNLGDIDRQTIGGAISTATHGTGAELPNLAAQVEAIELLGPDGEVRRLTAGGDPELLRAARVGVGSLGVITAVTLRTVPSFNLHRVDAPMPLDEVLNEFDRLAGENEHFEFFIFPHTETALTIRRNRTERPPAPRGRLERYLSDVVIENGLGNLALKATGKVPTAIPRTARFSSKFMAQAEQVDVSHRVFANYRTIRFTEMEYALPREAAPEALLRVLDLIRTERFPLAMPIECRVVAGDDALLSPTHERASAYLAVHQYHGLVWRPYFEAIERVFDSYRGRPHWGKRHSKDAAALAPLYPEWARFRAARDELDPGRVFSNAYVREVLGP
ncbi:MAG: FAD-binding protein [Solirubrobacterales bacterium]|nr:FAD-binding protein [Solirubrobacterales bacterium]